MLKRLYVAALNTETRVLGTGERIYSTWRFMGSYKGVISPLIWVISIVTPTITPFFHYP